jgi:hypothetical protein
MNGRKALTGDKAESPHALVAGCIKPVRMVLRKSRFFTLAMLWRSRDKIGRHGRPSMPTSGMARTPPSPPLVMARWFPGPLPAPDGPVAQLDRVADFYSAGCRFEPCRDRQQSVCALLGGAIGNSPLIVFIFARRLATTPDMPKRPELTSCHDCGSGVSFSAMSCPHCGSTEPRGPYIHSRSALRRLARGRAQRSHFDRNDFGLRHRWHALWSHHGDQPALEDSSGGGIWQPWCTDRRTNCIHRQHDATSRPLMTHVSHAESG